MGVVDVLIGRPEGPPRRGCVLEGRVCTSVLQDDRAAEAGLQPVRSPVATIRRTVSARCSSRRATPNRRHDPGGDRTRGLRIKSQEVSEPFGGRWRKDKQFATGPEERGGLKLPDDEPKLVG